MALGNPTGLTVSGRQKVFLARNPLGVVAVRTPSRIPHLALVLSRFAHPVLLVSSFCLFCIGSA
eukprot:5452818-Amphidinium_carterae.1